MTLIELRDKINEMLDKNPSWGDVGRVGIVTAKYEDNGIESVDMEMLVDLRDICCDGHGMVAFQLVLEDDDTIFGTNRAIQLC